MADSTTDTVAFLTEVDLDDKENVPSVAVSAEVLKESEKCLMEVKMEGFGESPEIVAKKIATAHVSDINLHPEPTVYFSKPNKKKKGTLELNKCSRLKNIKGIDPLDLMVSHLKTFCSKHGIDKKYGNRKNGLIAAIIEHKDNPPKEVTKPDVAECDTKKIAIFGQSQPLEFKDSKAKPHQISAMNRTTLPSTKRKAPVLSGSFGSNPIIKKKRGRGRPKKESSVPASSDTYPESTAREENSFPPKISTRLQRLEDFLIGSQKERGCVLKRLKTLEQEVFGNQYDEELKGIVPRLERLEKM
eukprot:CAMPEP_0197263976 /NCGR_PEP_ID=MMETSP1432-20130617/1509_1 /TAXON_ID=44447 /ORGANISM="Pseudo-nitzschia delicatissima, Strain UNC1205" /LENGTH=300 /DNA_ID=CAMNT_0042728559 /DNA_START=78 /DNA_END=980 /DNA_ORIENTATION=+